MDRTVSRRRIPQKKKTKESRVSGDFLSNLVFVEGSVNMKIKAVLLELSLYYSNLSSDMVARVLDNYHTCRPFPEAFVLNCLLVRNFGKDSMEF